MVGWHHRLDGHEFEQPLGVGGGQGSLACCSPWGCKELDMVLEKTLESHSDSREIKQSVLKDISPEYSWEGLMLKLKLQYFDHLMRRTDSWEKTLMLGKIEHKRKRE